MPRSSRRWRGRSRCRSPIRLRLEDLLIDVQQRTATATYPGIPIFADPVGFFEAGVTLWWAVEIDLEGVPLRESLRLCLAQLHLGYEVRDGRLRITSARGKCRNLASRILS